MSDAARRGAIIWLVRRAAFFSGRTSPRLALSVVAPVMLDCSQAGFSDGQEITQGCTLFRALVCRPCFNLSVRLLQLGDIFFDLDPFRHDASSVSLPLGLRALLDLAVRDRDKGCPQQSSFHGVEQKEIGKERQPSAVGSAHDAVVAVQFTVSTGGGQGCGHALFSQVREPDGAPSGGAAGLGSPGTAEQRHQRDRMRHGRTRTMRQQRVRMPLPQVAATDAREATRVYLSFPNSERRRAAANVRPVSAPRPRA